MSLTTSPSESMPSVMHVSMPSAFTPSTMAHTHVHVAALGRAPGGAHAVAGGAGILRLAGLGEHASTSISLLALEAGGVVRRLAAIAAILGAAAGLDGEQPAPLHGVRLEVAAMDRVRLEQEIVERRIVECLSLLAGPVMAQRAVGRLARQRLAETSAVPSYASLPRGAAVRGQRATRCLHRRGAAPQGLTAYLRQAWASGQEGAPPGRGGSPGGAV